MDPFLVAIFALYGLGMHKMFKDDKERKRKYANWLWEHNLKDSDYHKFVFACIEDGETDIMTEEEYHEMKERWEHEEAMHQESDNNDDDWDYNYLLN